MFITSSKVICRVMEGFKKGERGNDGSFTLDFEYTRSEDVETGDEGKEAPFILEEMREKFYFMLKNVV